MSTKTALVLVAGFIAGCGAAVVAPLVIPPAHAQTTTRWETLCHTINAPNTEVGARVTELGSRAGAEGWELVSAPTTPTSTYSTVCFKRPAP